MRSDAPLTLSELLLDCGQEIRFAQDRLWFAFSAKTGAYFLGGASPAPMHAASAYVFAGPAEIRASKLSPSRLVCFHVAGQDLAGLLTPPERQFMELRCRNNRGAALVYPPEAPISLLFQKLADTAGEKLDLLHRTQAMQLLGEFFRANAFPPTSPLAQTGELGAAESFEKLIQSMPESALLEASSEDLAEKCGCSQRHFSRLYAARFGQSLKQRQVELRLEKARGLLQDPQMRVIDAAMESGFKHLSLFNALFKARYGSTPSSSRKPLPSRMSKPAKKLPLSRMAAAFACMLACGAARAAEPAAPPKKEALFTIKRYEVQGNTLLPTSDLEKILADHTGTNITSATIQKALQSLVLAYRGKGYMTVGVGLPSPQINDGVLKVQVVEGKLADIKITGNKWFSTNNIQRALPSLKTNLVLNNRWFQPELDKANQNGDRQIYPVVEPGPEPGTSALNLKVKDRIPLHARAEFNNRNSAGTPPFRADFASQYNNLWQLEHSVGLQYNFVPDKMKAEDRMPRFFDQPLIASYSGFYRIPVGSPRPLKDAFDTNPGGFGYDEVSRQMRLPPMINNPDLIFFASRSDSDTGVLGGGKQLITKTPFVEVNQMNSTEVFSSTEDLGTRFTQPLPELKRLKSFFSFGMDYKYYRSQNQSTNINSVDLYSLDKFGNPTLVTNVTVALPGGSLSSARYLPISAGLNFVLPDKLGASSLSLNSSLFLQDLTSYNADFQKISGSKKAGGTFQVLTASFAREQKIYDEWTALIRMNGQYTDRPLIGNEQIAMGGSSGVRGYREGEEYGDTGWKIQVEPRTPLINIGLVDDTMPMLLRFSLFADYGERYLLDPGSRARRMEQLGTGVAMQMSVGQHWDARVTVAWPLLETIYAKDPAARAYFSVGAQF